MHDLYYKGRIHARVNHVNSGYNNKRAAKVGTEDQPLTLIVNSEARQLEVAQTVSDHSLFANISVDGTVAENIVELDTILNKPKTTTFEKTPNRNDPCSCDSGKKYKKCCG